MSCIFIAALTVLAALLTAEAKAQTDEDARQEPKEITIHVREHKRVAAALLDAVEKGTTFIKIADFDSLSSTFGLIGIFKKRKGSPFYGYYFRLMFPPEADLAAIELAYAKLPYTESFRRSSLKRILIKVGFGAAVGIGSLIGAGNASGGGLGGGILGLFVGQFLGYPLGVYLVDRESSFLAGVAGSVFGYWAAVELSDSNYFGELTEPVAWSIYLGLPIILSELSRIKSSPQQAQ